ncbi:MAG: COX15/CtaA family protein [Planctomycetes bacterium]|nr:COX15/CtaA family protein [Planctomycetota bacterium]
MSAPSPVVPAASPWPRRLAWATWCATIPLVFFGGSVTSLHAGLAIDGWWVVDPGKGDFFLPLYPLDRWVHSLGAFVEHTHRLLGMLVGLLAIATVVAAFLREKRGLPRALALLGLVAIVGQGVLGGLRVLEKSTDLAFLHGSIGQAVFALLGAAAFAMAPSEAASGRVAAEAPAQKRLLLAALAATAVVYAQIVIGAWLRHGQSLVALVAHVVMLMFVAGAVTFLAHALRKAAEENGGAADERALRRTGIALWSVFWAQLTLGMLAFVWVYVVVGKDRVPTELHQSFFPTLHVLGGAALLFCCVASLVRALRRRAVPEHATATTAVRAGAAG